jgi:hypothetical protein
MDLDASIQMPIKERFYRFNNKISNLENEFILNAGISKAVGIVKRGATLRNVANHNFENGLISIKNKKRKNILSELVNEVNILVFGMVNLCLESDKRAPLSKYYNIRGAQISGFRHKTRHKDRKIKYLQQIKEYQKKHKKQAQIEAEIQRFFDDIKHNRITENSTYNLPLKIWNDDIKNILLKTTPATVKKIVDNQPTAKDFHNDMAKSVYFTKPPKYEDFERPWNLYTQWQKDFYTFHKENWKSVSKQLKTYNKVKYYNVDLHKIETRGNYKQQ